MHRKIFRFSIFHKILIAMFFISMIPLSGLWYLISFDLQSNIESQIKNELKEEVNHIVRKVDDWTDMNVRVLRQNSLLEDIKSMETDRQKPIVDAINKAYEWTYLVYVIGADGYKTARSDNKPIYNPDGTKKHYRGDRVYFKQVMNGKNKRLLFGNSSSFPLVKNKEFLGEQVLLSRTTGKPAFILSYPIRNKHDAITGVFCIGTTLVDMSNEVTSIKLGETGYAILLDRQGKVIAHGKSNRIVNALEDLSNHPVYYASENNGQLVTYRQDDVKMVALSGKTSLGWTVIVEREYNDAFSALERAKLRGIAFIGATTLIILITSLFLARRMTSPIRSLSIKADRLSMGKMYVKIDETQRSDEIGEMAQAVERMGASIKIAMAKMAGN